MDLGDDRDADFKQHGFLALLPFDLLEQARILERGGSLQRQAFEQALVFAVEVAGTLVQHLGDADHLAVLVADRNAEDVARAVAGAPVHLLVEARIGVGVGDDFRLAAGEHRAGDAEPAGEADLADDVALHDAREQFIGFGIVQEQRTAVGVQRLGHHLHQARKQYVEGKAVGNAVGNVGQRRGAAQHLGNAEEQLGLARLVESVQEFLDVLLVQAVLENFANDFEADLHTQCKQKTSGLNVFYCNHNRCTPLARQGAAWRGSGQSASSAWRGQETR